MRPLKIFSTTNGSRSWLTDWGTNWLTDWLTGWLTDISLALNSSNWWSLLLALYVTRSAFLIESDEFLTKIHFFQKLLEYLIIKAVHSKDLVEGYTLIPVHFHTHIFRGDTAKNVNFSRISQNFGHFWKLKFLISPKLQQHLKNKLTQ